MDVLALIFAIGLGFGVACWACGTLLDKSNNIGDSVGSKDIYGIYVHFTCERRLNKKEIGTFCISHAKPIEGENNAPSGSELVHRLTPEELRRYGTVKQEGDAPSRPVNPTEEEFKLWESKQPGTDMKGVFRPLDDE